MNRYESWRVRQVAYLWNIISELPRIHLLGTSVNKGKKKGRGMAAPAPIAVLKALSSLLVALRRDARHVHRYERLVSYYPSVVPWRYHRLLTGTDLRFCLYSSTFRFGEVL